MKEDRFYITAYGTVFDALYSTSVTPPAMPQEKTAIICYLLNKSQFNGVYVNCVSIGYDPSSNETILLGAGAEIVRFISPNLPNFK